MPDHFHRPIDRDWQHHASCRGTDTDMFFSPDGERGNVRARREHAAKQICQDCPVLADCRAHALTATESYGIWGGLSETERARHTRRTRHAGPTPRVWRVTGPFNLADPNTQNVKVEQSWPPTTTHHESPNPTSRRTPPSNS